VEALLDVIADLPLTLLRALLPVSANERFASLLRAIERMAPDARARLLAVVSANAGGTRRLTDADLIERPGDLARVILRRLDGEEHARGENEVVAEKSRDGDVTAARSDVHWIKSVLAARASGGARAAPAGPTSAALLQTLIEEYPADAVPFLQVLRAARLTAAALLSEPASDRLFASSLRLLPERAAAIVRAMLQLVSRLPAHEQPGDETSIRTAAMGAVLGHASVARATGSREQEARLVAAVLGALFGSPVAAGTVRHLAAEAQRKIEAGEPARDHLIVLREIFDELVRRGGIASSEAETLQALASPRDQTSVDASGDAGQIVAMLNARARGQRGAGPRESGDSSSAALLQTLIERYPHAARTWLDTMRQAGLAPSALLAGEDAARLFTPSLELLQPLHRRLVTLVLRIASSLPAGQRPGTDAEIRSRLAGVVLDEAVPGAGDRIAASALRAVFGVTLQHSVRASLIGAAERFARTEGYGPAAVTTFLQLLRADDEVRPQMVREAPRDVARPTTADDAAAHPPAPPSASGVDAPRIQHDAMTGEEATTGAAAAEEVATAGEVAKAGEVARTGEVGTVEEVTTADEIAGAEVTTADEVTSAEEVTGAEEITRAEEVTRAEYGAVAAAAVPARPPDPGPHPRERSLQDGSAALETAGALARLGLQDAEPESGARLRPAVERLSEDARRQMLLELIDSDPDVLREAVREAAADAAVRDRWVRELTEPELARIAFLLDSSAHRQVLAAGELLFAAWDSIASRPRPASVVRTDLWSSLLALLARQTDASRSLDVLVREIFALAGEQAAGETSEPATTGSVRDRLADAAAALAERSGRARLREAISRQRAEPIAPASASDRRSTDEGSARSESQIAGRFGGAAPAPPAPVTPDAAKPPRRRRTAFAMDEEQAEVAGEPIHIANAGLVIVGAFLPQLFERLDVVEATAESGRRVRPDAVSRTVHLLQYLVDGRTNAPEPLLCLNKILCGVPLAVPVEREIEMTERERELCDTLLAAVIANWSMISNTSVAGLRETFLQREGRLDHPSNGWRLRVQRKTLDVLLDYIPWTISTIGHSWMPEPLFVTW
jgi:hypothetical protein